MIRRRIAAFVFVVVTAPAQRSVWVVDSANPAGTHFNSMHSSLQTIPWLCLAAWVCAQDPAPRPKDAPAQAVIRGRCVASESGQPLGNCKIEWNGWPEYGQGAHQELECRSGADGTFELRFEPLPKCQFSMTVSHEKRAPRTARWSHSELPKDIGDVKMEPGFSLEVRITDADGRPANGVFLRFPQSRMPLNGGGAIAESSGVSNAEGLLLVDAPLPPGNHEFEVGPGFELADGALNVIDVLARPTSVTLQVRRLPSISGTVFDDRGKPVAGAMILAKPGFGTFLNAGTAWSQDDGSFLLIPRAGAVEASNPVTLVVADAGMCQPANVPGEHRWGASGLRIDLRSMLSFALTVVEAGSGKPIENYGVRCFAALPDSRPMWPEVRAGDEPHLNGVVQVTGVWHGKNYCCVAPVDPWFAATRLLQIDAQPATLAPMRIELQRLEPIDARLVDATGAPIPLADTWLVDDFSNGKWDLAQGMFFDPRGTWEHSSGGLPVENGDERELGLVLAMSSAKTDANGRVRLYHGPARGKLALVVGRAGQWLVHRDFQPHATGCPTIELK